MITMCGPKRLIALISIFIAFFTHVFAQTDPDNLGLSENIMGLSNKPTAQFGQPVIGTSDLYTGMATYNIPLFELKSHDLKVPVSLNYASGGVKVGEIGGWLGITWRLNAGGEIAREMKGYPDELPGKGYFVHGDKAKDFVSKTNDEKIDIISKSQQKGYDMQPDVFHYSFGGESGYFVFDNEQHIHLVPHKNWLITETITDDKLTAFKVKTNNGTTYIFGKTYTAIEETKISTLSSSAAWNFSGSSPVLGFSFLSVSEESPIDDFYNSKWYLTEIISPSQDKITFEYDDAGTLSYVDAPQIMAYETMTGLQWEPYNDPYFGTIPALKPHLMAYDILTFNWDLNTGPWDGAEIRGSHPTCLDDIWEPKPCLDTRSQSKVNYPLRYFFHQNKIETKSKILSDIIASNNASIHISHDVSSTIPGACRINHIALKDISNKEIKGYYLEYNKVISNSADPSGVYADPFSPMEYFAFLEVQIPRPGSEYVPANMAQNYFSTYDPPQKDLMTKYVIEGMKAYNYERFFLEELRESIGETSVPPYTFSYNAPENIIRRTSVWSGQSNYSRTGKPSQIIFKLVESVGYQVSDGISQPVGTSFGQLEKIILPSGGFVQYKYQDTKDQNNVVVSGVKRVEKIIQNDGSESYTKEFIYRGIGHFVHHSYSRGIQFLDLKNATENRMNINTSYDLEEVDYTKGSPIGYKIVQVKNCADINCTWSEGYEEYEFTSLQIKDANSGLVDDIHGLTENNRYGLTYVYPKSYELIEKSLWFKPDRFSGGEDSHYVIERSADFEKEFSSGNYGYFSSRDYARGLLKRHTVYSEIGVIQETVNTYSILNYSNVKGLNGRTYNFGIEELVGDDNCIFNDCINDWDRWYLQRHIANVSIHYSSEVTLTSTSETIYDANFPGNVDKSVNVETNLEYATRGGITTYLTSSTKSNDLGETIRSEYRYPIDFQGNSVIQAMYNRNIITPIEVISYKNDKVINASFTSYLCKDCVPQPFTHVLIGPILPKESFSLETNIPLLSSDYHKVTPDLGRDSRLKLKVHFDEYDDKGNLLQYGKEFGTNTSFLWAYNQTYPVAKIENSTYDNVKNALSGIGSSVSDIQTKSLESDDETKLLQIFNNLRNSSLMQGAFISSYTYNPGIGITSETDPLGNTTYYDYDALGRLIMIRNHKLEILKVYDYHYKSPYFFTKKELVFSGINFERSHMTMFPSTFTANISEGSGTFSYKWELRKNGNIVATSNTSELKYVFKIPGIYEASCTIKDLLMGKSLTKSTSIFWDSSPH